MHKKRSAHSLLLWGLLANLSLTLVALVVAERSNDTMLSLAEERYGAKARRTVLAWRQMIRHDASKSDLAKLTATNHFFNQRIRFLSDQHIWSQDDYWATPLETMGKASGDCEDFSIAKYVSLLQMGVPPRKLRLVYVKAVLTDGRTQAHMVLAYYSETSSEPLILDNLRPEILPASTRSDLHPVFSFNSEGLWLGNEKNAREKQPQKRLSRWRDVLLRMQKEGLNYP